MSPSKSITPAEAFRGWASLMGYKNQSETAAALGVHRNTIVNYETGKTPIPLVTWLAMSALYHRLAPWEGLQ